MYKKGKQSKFTKRTAVAWLAAVVLSGISGCGREKSVLLETVPEGRVESGGMEDILPGEAADESIPGKNQKKNNQKEESRETCLEETIQVHVCGAVEKPGVYGLPAGSRVFEAVEAAGGMAEEAAEDYLNLAELLFDGAKVRVPFSEELSEGKVYGEAGIYGVTGNFALENPETFSQDKNGLVDLNHANKEELMALPGIGEARAEAILAWREEHGAFQKPEDIMQVSGIKEAAYEKLKDKITVR